MLIERGDRPPEVERITGYDGLDVSPDGDLLAVFNAEIKYAMGAKPFKAAMSSEQLSAAIDRVNGHLESVQARLEKNKDTTDSTLSGNFNRTKHVLAELEKAQTAIMSMPEGLVDRIREQAQSQILDKQSGRGFFERMVAAITNG